MKVAGSLKGKGRGSPPASEPFTLSPIIKIPQTRYQIPAELALFTLLDPTLKKATTSIDSGVKLLAVPDSHKESYEVENLELKRTQCLNTVRHIYHAIRGSDRNRIRDLVKQLSKDSRKLIREEALPKDAARACYLNLITSYYLNLEMRETFYQLIELKSFLPKNLVPGFEILKFIFAVKSENRYRMAPTNALEKLANIPEGNDVLCKFVLAQSYHIWQDLKGIKKWSDPFFQECLGKSALMPQLVYQDTLTAIILTLIRSRQGSTIDIPIEQLDSPHSTIYYGIMERRLLRDIEKNYGHLLEFYTKILRKNPGGEFAATLRKRIALIARECQKNTPPTFIAFIKQMIRTQILYKQGFNHYLKEYRNYVFRITYLAAEKPQSQSFARSTLEEYISFLKELEIYTPSAVKLLARLYDRVHKAEKAAELYFTLPTHLLGSTELKEVFYYKAKAVGWHYPSSKEFPQLRLSEKNILILMNVAWKIFKATKENKWQRQVKMLSRYLKMTRSRHRARTKIESNTDLVV